MEGSGLCVWAVIWMSENGMFYDGNCNFHSGLIKLFFYLVDKGTKIFFFYMIVWGPLHV